MVRHPRPRLSRPALVRDLARAIRRAARQPLPRPPAALRRGPLRPDAFGSALRSERLTAWLGLWLGAAFGVCLLTGLISHQLQHPAGWFTWPTRPVGLYRVTQGLHVATGLAAIPLLLAKLWAVYPKLFTWPPARDAAHALSRLGVLALVASVVFELASGVLNIARWYTPLGFSFPVAHYWTAWIATGALLIHLSAQATIVRQVLCRPEPGPVPQTAIAAAAERPALGRRGLLTAIGAAAGVLTISTIGQTVAPLASVSLLAPRRPHLGPQRLPVNKSAQAARVLASARDPRYRLTVHGPRPLTLTTDELAARPQHTVDLPIACVEGWSASARWTGLRLRDLLADAGLDPSADIRIESLERRGAYRASTLPAAFARDPLTLLALRLNGSILHPDHGYPCRLIAPNRPGVQQTKWVTTLRPARR